MSEINLEGHVPREKNNQNSFAVKGAEDMTIEELVECIRHKIQKVHKNKAQELKHHNK